MPIPWGLALVTAPFVPTMVFWTSILISLANGERGSWLMPGISVAWLAIGLALARAGRSTLKGVGIGLVTGAVPCLLWTTGMSVA